MEEKKDIERPVAQAEQPKASKKKASKAKHQEKPEIGSFSVENLTKHVINIGGFCIHPGKTQEVTKDVERQLGERGMLRLQHAIKTERLGRK